MLGGRVPDLTMLERTVNGQPGLVVQQDGVTAAVIAFEVVGERIKHIWAVRNPEKLRPWTSGLTRVSVPSGPAASSPSQTVNDAGL